MVKKELISLLGTCQRRWDIQAQQGSVKEIREGEKRRRGEPWGLGEGVGRRTGMEQTQVTDYVVGKRAALDC